MSIVEPVLFAAAPLVSAVVYCPPVIVVVLCVESEIVAVVAVTFVAAVIKAALICVVVPVITIAFDTVGVNDVLFPILDKTVAAIDVVATSLIVNVRTSLLSVAKVLQFVAVSVAVAVILPIVPLVVFVGQALIALAFEFLFGTYSSAL